MNNVVLRGIARVTRPFGVELPAPVALFARPNNYLLGETYHSASPLRYGEYARRSASGRYRTR